MWAFLSLLSLLHEPKRAKAVRCSEEWNTIPPHQQPAYPGDREMERRLRNCIRWNAAAMVVRANKKFAGLGGHISTFASSATLYQVGIHHFWRGRGQRTKPCGRRRGRSSFFLQSRVPGQRDRRTSPSSSTLRRPMGPLRWRTMRRPSACGGCRC